MHGDVIGTPQRLQFCYSRFSSLARGVRDSIFSGESTADGLSVGFFEARGSCAALSRMLLSSCVESLLKLNWEFKDANKRREFWFIGGREGACC